MNRNHFASKALILAVFMVFIATSACQRLAQAPSGSDTKGWQSTALINNIQFSILDKKKNTEIRFIPMQYPAYGTIRKFGTGMLRIKPSGGYQLTQYYNFETIRNEVNDAIAHNNEIQLMNEMFSPADFVVNSDADGIVDARPPTEGLSAYIFASRPDLKKYPVKDYKTEITFEVVKMKLNITNLSFYRTGEILMSASLESPENFSIFRADGLPVYSSDQNKIIGFVSWIGKNKDREDPTVLIASVHSKSFRDYMLQFMPTFDGPAHKYVGIESDFKKLYCNLDYVRSAIFKKIRQQNAMDPLIQENACKGNGPTAPWEQLSLCQPDYTAAEVQQAIATAVDSTHQKKIQEICGCAKASGPTWISNKKGADELRQK